MEPREARLAGDDNARLDKIEKDQVRFEGELRSLADTVRDLALSVKGSLEKGDARFKEITGLIAEQSTRLAGAGKYSLTQWAVILTLLLGVSTAAGAAAVHYATLLAGIADAEREELAARVESLAEIQRLDREASRREADITREMMAARMDRMERRAGE